jgi:hypothetical protein
LDRLADWIAGLAAGLDLAVPGRVFDREFEQRPDLPATKHKKILPHLLFFSLFSSFNNMDSFSTAVLQLLPFVHCRFS